MPMSQRGETLLILGAILIVSCSTILGVRGNGNIRSETRDVGAFDAIDLSGEGHVIIEISNETSLVVDAEENLLPLLTSRVENGVLELDNTESVDPTEEIVYKVSMPLVTSLDLSGSGRIDAPDVSGEAIAIDVSGSGAVYLENGNLDQVAADISGSGYVEISGGATSLDVVISGSGSVDAGELSVTRSSVDVSGSGSVVVNVSDIMDIDVSGSGSVEYFGNPQTINSSVSGSGSIEARN